MFLFFPPEKENLPSSLEHCFPLLYTVVHVNTQLGVGHIDGLVSYLGLLLNVEFQFASLSS